MNLFRRTAAAVFCSGALVSGALFLTSPAGAEPAGAQAVAKCAAHHLNTAYWATCTSGSTTSKVRVAGLCDQLIGSDKWRYSAWRTVPAGSSTPVRGECTLGVNGSKVEVAPL